VLHRTSADPVRIYTLRHYRRIRRFASEPVHIAPRSSSPAFGRFEQKAIAAGLSFRRNRNTRPL
jgi:hypothetical protein